MALNAFTGKWKAKISEDFAKFLKEMGVIDQIIAFLAADEIVFEVIKTGERKIKIDSGGKGGYECELEKEFDDAVFGIPAKCIMVEKDGGLLKTAKLSTGGEVKVVYKFQGNQYTESYTYGSHTGLVKFEKVK